MINHLVYNTMCNTLGSANDGEVPDDTVPTCLWCALRVYYAVEELI